MEATNKRAVSIGDCGVKARLQCDLSGCAVDGNDLAVDDAIRRVAHTQHSRHAVLAGDDSPMRELPTRLQHQSAGQREHRRPARIGGMRDEDVTRLKAADVAQVLDDTSGAPRLPTASGDAMQYKPLWWLSLMRGCAASVEGTP